MTVEEKLVIFTDLDGTLLDHANYSFDAARPALRLIEERGVPLVICSSKTRSEIELYRQRLSNRHPFISENGGGIFIPKAYFSAEPTCGSAPILTDDDYVIIRLGSPYEELRKALGQLKEKGYDLRGFGDMTSIELSALTNLSPEEATLSRAREFDEPFTFSGDEGAEAGLLRAVAKMGLNWTRGRFYHLMGDSDKGKAVSILSDLYRKEFGGCKTVALGDSPNDIPMLKSVDMPIIVQKKEGAYDPEIIDTVKKVSRAEGIGPEGWNKAVLALLSNQSL